jgi:hypothetical protein
MAIRIFRDDMPSANFTGFPLGYQDSNLEWLNQNQLCCQLHHTPMACPDVLRGEAEAVVRTEENNSKAHP